MTQTSPNLDLPLVMPDQAQKHVTVNESLLRLDALAQLSVESRSIFTQPDAAEEGSSWILPEDASGPDWDGMAAGSLAVYRDGFWREYAPRDGWQAAVRDEGLGVRFSGRRNRWCVASAMMPISEGGLGAETRSRLMEMDVAGLSGSPVSTGLVIPDRAIILGVSIRVIETLTGLSSFDCGIAGEPGKFGSDLDITAGAVNLGVIGPHPVYADTPVVLSANDGGFAGGRVRLALHLLEIRAPQ